MADDPDTRRAEHRRKLESLGLSADDWQRIKAMAEDSAKRPSGPFGALDDLSRPLRIAAVPRDSARHYSGQQIGTWAGQALLMWVMTNRQVEEWARRTREREARKGASSGK